MERCEYNLSYIKVLYMCEYSTYTYMNVCVYNIPPYWLDCEAGLCAHNPAC